MTEIRPSVTFAAAPSAYDQRDQNELRRAIARLIASIATATATPGSFSVGDYLRARDGHFRGGISIGQLSDPYVLATRHLAGGSLAANDYEVGITSLDALGNESFAQQVTVTGVLLNEKIEVDIVPIAGAVSYRTYLRIAAGSWTDTGDVDNTFQQTLTYTALGAATTAPPATNASEGELLSAFVHNCTVEGGPSFFQLNLGQAVNSQSAFFFSDYYGICASFQTKGTGSTAPAGGKTEFDIAFNGDTCQLYVGNAGTKELDFFVYGGGAFNLVQLMQSTFISNNVNVVMAPAGTADVTPTNYASRLLEFQNSVWESGAPTTHAWRILNNSSNQLEIEYDANVPIWINSSATYSRIQLRASGSVEHLLEDTTGPLNSKYIGVINDDGGLTFRFYNDNLTTKGDYLTISAAGVVSIPGGISGTVPASAVTAGTFGAGAYTFPSSLALTGALTGVTTLAASGDVTMTNAAALTLSLVRGTMQGALQSGASQLYVGTLSSHALELMTGGVTALTIASTQAATFASSLAITGALTGVTTGAFSGLISASGGIFIDGGTAGAGRIRKDATVGMLIRGIVGASYDVEIANAAGNSVLLIPTATTNVVFAGAVSGVTTATVGQLIANGTNVAGNYSVDVTAASGAARDVLRAGVAGISNGLTVQYSGAVMQYIFESVGASTFTVNTPSATFAGSLAITGALSGVTTYTGTGLIQTTVTTEQMRLRYDASNYLSTTVGSTGIVTLDATGAGAAFNFTNSVGIDQPAPTSKFDITTNSLGVTQTETSGVALVNETAATLGTQQVSPAVRFTSEGFIQAGSVRSVLDWRVYGVGQLGGTGGTGKLVIDHSASGGAYTELLALASDDTGRSLTVAGGVGATWGTFSGALSGASLSTTGALTVDGNTTLGNATSDTITATGRFNTNIVPSTDSARDLGTSALYFNNLYAKAVTLGSGLGMLVQAAPTAGDYVDTVNGYSVNDVKVIGPQGAAVTDPTGGAVQDAEARTAIIAIIDRLQAHGLIA